MTIDTSHIAQISSNELETRANFKSFGESTKQDWDNIMVQLQVTQSRVADHIIKQLEYLRHDFGGFPVNRLEHCLQTATLAQRDGRDDEYVLCALIHDIGDNLSPYNHASVAAAILYPVVSLFLQAQE
jgi:predicted HD phosphohydrolase